jgi:hypothetical protein
VPTDWKLSGAVFGCRAAAAECKKEATGTCPLSALAALVPGKLLCASAEHVLRFDMHARALQAIMQPRQRLPHFRVCRPKAAAV